MIETEPAAPDDDRDTGEVDREDDLAVARRVFGERAELAGRYHGLLATAGIERGLIGPREAPRLWRRHLLNCAVLAERVPAGARVADVGSGAGLPGIVLAIARPDLEVVLIEPMARRVAFLDEAVAELGLSGTTVLRARAEELVSRRAVRAGGPASSFTVVTARALAPLDRLAGWCLPLAVPGGRVLAAKGESAEDEVVRHADAVRRLGGTEPVVLRLGAGVVDPPTTVVEIVRRSEDPPARRGRRGRGAR